MPQSPVAPRTGLRCQAGRRAPARPSPLQPLPSNLPYAHWDYNLLIFASKAGWDCGAAFLDSSYTSYSGSLDAAQLRNPAFYTDGTAAAGGAGGGHQVAGWAPYDCSAAMRYVCVLPGSLFPLPEPPAVPADPPQPPSPPSPPQPESCAPPAGPAFFCEQCGLLCS
jgi:hypothetical protein